MSLVAQESGFGRPCDVGMEAGLTRAEIVSLACQAPANGATSRPPCQTPTPLIYSVFGQELDPEHQTSRLPRIKIHCELLR
jgi:hypothetical protein